MPKSVLGIEIFWTIPGTEGEKSAGFSHLLQPRDTGLICQVNAMCLAIKREFPGGILRNKLWLSDLFDARIHHDRLHVCVRGVEE